MASPLSGVAAQTATVDAAAVHRRRPATGPEHDRRVAWGKKWGALGKLHGQLVREGK